MTRWAWFLLPALLCLALAWLARQTAVPQTLSLPAITTCDGQLRPVYAFDAASAKAVNGGWDLNGESVLEQAVCQPGTLTFTASGTVAGGSGPRVEVDLDGEPLLSAVVGRPETFQVPVARAGRLHIAYTNDFLRSERREVTLTDIRLAAPCRKFTGRSSSTSAPWRPPYIAVYLAPPAQLTVTPCGRGTLTALATATAVAGVYPVLVISTGQTIALTAATQRVQIPLSGPATVQISNPAFRTTADRNLQLREIRVP
ncbi:hypothetical protein [Deinococcus yunweiensis]|uniref:hypothetical protein n=1 Tax=Deinococcus yunweiensis TaxID=367282 RepID=UPI00398EF235